MSQLADDLWIYVRFPGDGYFSAFIKPREPRDFDKSARIRHEVSLNLHEIVSVAEIIYFA